MLRKLWKELDQKEINCRKNKQTKDNQKTEWNIKDIKYIKIKTTLEIDTELLNPLIISQTKQRERVKIKKRTQALNYSRVTSQARYRHGDSARDGDTYLVKHGYE